ncbi:MAG: hypothetical protein ACR2P1_14930 [Pseudomonadales bacterium]
MHTTPIATKSPTTSLGREHHFTVQNFERQQRWIRQLGKELIGMLRLLVLSAMTGRFPARLLS